MDKQKAKIIKKHAQVAVSNVTNNGELNQIKAKYLGKKSDIAAAISKLPKLTIAQKKIQGKLINDLRRELEEIFYLQEQKLINSITYPPIDMSVPATHYTYGHLHPTTRILNEIYEIFSFLGFDIVDGPEIETDWYNFEVLNIPPDHPARDLQDTFYLTDKFADRPLVPRTQTSAMQVRYLEKNKPPVKIIVPGKVFRNENEDITHSWIFNQAEGLVVGEGISLSDLKGTLEYFVKSILGKKSKIRLRPSYFPYTEPSVEVDGWCEGDWLELLGAGMVHPKVLENAGVDSTKYSGFAFGVGIERLSQIKYGITDLRANWRTNLDILKGF